jgi:hypothetical protein
MATVSGKIAGLLEFAGSVSADRYMDHEVNEAMFTDLKS